MKSIATPVGLIIMSTVMLIGAVYLSSENKTQREQIKQLQNENNGLKSKIEDLNERNYNDSTLLSEYQLGLDEFLDEDPIAAEKFMKHIERAFE